MYSEVTNFLKIITLNTDLLKIHCILSGCLEKKINEMLKTMAIFWTTGIKWFQLNGVKLPT